MPLSAVTGRAEVMNSVHVGGLGGTWRNPFTAGDGASSRSTPSLLFHDPRESAKILQERLQLGKAPSPDQNVRGFRSHDGG
ncbi:MAG: hypothetical protein U0V70_00265 [Terriglobia bacterium]